MRKPRACYELNRLFKFVYFGFRNGFGLISAAMIVQTFAYLIEAIESPVAKLGENANLKLESDSIL